MISNQTLHAESLQWLENDQVTLRSGNVQTVRKNFKQSFVTVVEGTVADRISAIFLTGQ